MSNPSLAGANSGLGTLLPGAGLPGAGQQRPSDTADFTGDSATLAADSSAYSGTPPNLLFSSSDNEPSALPGLLRFAPATDGNGDSSRKKIFLLDDINDDRRRAELAPLSSPEELTVREAFMALHTQVYDIRKTIHPDRLERSYSIPEFEAKIVVGNEILPDLHDEKKQSAPVKSSTYLDVDYAYSPDLQKCSARILFVPISHGGPYWDVENRSKEPIQVLSGERILAIAPGSRFSACFEKPAGLQNDDALSFLLTSADGATERHALLWQAPVIDATTLVLEAELTTADMHELIGHEGAVRIDSVPVFPFDREVIRTKIRVCLETARALAKIAGAGHVSAPVPLQLDWSNTDEKFLTDNKIEPLDESLPEDEYSDAREARDDIITEAALLQTAALAREELRHFPELASLRLLIKISEEPVSFVFTDDTGFGLDPDSRKANFSYRQEVKQTSPRTLPALSATATDFSASALESVRVIIAAELEERTRLATATEAKSRQEKGREEPAHRDESESEEDSHFEKTPPSFRPQDFEFVLRHGIQDVGCLHEALKLIELLGGPWAVLIRNWNALVDEREREREAQKNFINAVLGNQHDGQGAFPIVIGTAPGAFCQRGMGTSDRRSELADGIYLERGSSIFTLIHELVHAIPIDALPRELSALPYTSSEEFTGVPNFENLFFHLLNSSYQDESISHFAEALLFRDLVAAGTPPEWFYEFDRDMLKETLDLCTRDGLGAYLRSDRYIGRNHRSSYNRRRIAEAAFAISFNPDYLRDPSLHRMLGESGIQVEGDTSPFLKHVSRIKQVLANPTPEALSALAMEFMASGVSVNIDIPRVLEILKEQFELATGTRRVASVSFIGKQAETQERVAMLAEIRRQFEAYQQEFAEAVANAPGGVLGNIDWADRDGLLAFHRYAAALAHRGDPAEQSRYVAAAEAAHQVLSGKFGFSKNILAADAARARQDVPAFRTAVANILQSINPFSPIKDDPNDYNEDIDEDDPPALAHLPNRDRDNHSLRLFLEILDDAAVAKHLGPGIYGDALIRILSTHLGLNDLMPEEEDGLVSDEFPTFAGAMKATREKGDPEACERFLLLLAARADRGELQQAINETSSFDNVATQRREEGDESDDEEKIDDAEREPIFAYLADTVVPMLHVAAARHHLKPLVYGYLRELELRDDSLYRAAGDIHIAAIRHTLTLAGYEGDDEDEFDGALPAIGTSRFPLVMPVWPMNAVDVPPAEILHAGLTASLNQATFEITVANTVVLEVRQFLMQPSRQGLGTLTQRFFDYFTSRIRHAPSPIDNATASRLQNASFWFETRLAVHLLRVLSRYGKGAVAEKFRTRILAEFAAVPLTITTDYFITAQRAIEAEILFAPYGAAAPDQRTDAAQEIGREYRAQVDLGRDGLRPADVISFLISCGDDFPRAALINLLHITIRHLSSYSPQSPVFQAGAAALLAALPQLDLSHQVRESLYHNFFEATLPESVSSGMVGAALGANLSAFSWIETVIITPDFLASIALFAQAESLVFSRCRKILKSIGSAQLPLQVRGRILAAAERLEVAFAHAHPELIRLDNSLALSRVSDGVEYQVDLADVFPSRRVAIDENLPVHEWNPGMVRRGLPDPARALEKIRAAVEDESQGPTPATLSVFTAFVDREIEARGNPKAVSEEIVNLSSAYAKRKRDIMSASPSVAAAGALTIAASAYRVFTAQEQSRIADITAIPAVHWVLGRTETAFASGPELSPLDTALLEALLHVATIADARRKRELHILILGDERYPRPLRRMAARSLAHGSHHGAVLVHLINSYESAGDDVSEENENSFYRMILEYWQRFGMLPDAQGLLDLDTEKHQSASYWSGFDSVFSDQSLVEITASSLELLARTKGRHAGYFLNEATSFAASKLPVSESTYLFKSDFAALPLTDFADRSRVREALRQVTNRRAERDEMIQIIRLDLPSAFLNLPAELRFIALRFIARMPQGQMHAILDEARSVAVHKSDTEMFAWFFKRTGLAKVGQRLSTLYGIIPDKDRAVFAELQDGMPASPEAEIRRTLESEYDKPLGSVFSFFGSRPIASASIADVHEAVLAETGEDVIVKVEPTTKERLNTQTARILVGIADDFAAAVKNGRFNTSIDVPGFIRAAAGDLRTQMRFTHELNSAERFSVIGLGTPRYFEELSTQRVLVMSRAPGVKLADISGPETCRLAARQYVNDAFRMFFIQQAYHKDPHPKNVFYDAASGRVTWIDWGLAGSISQAGLWNLSALLTSIVGDLDVERVAHVLYSCAGRASFEEIAAITEKLGTALADSDSLDLSYRLIAVLNAAGSEGVYMTREITDAVDFLLTVNGVARDLDPEINLLQVLWEIYASTD